MFLPLLIISTIPLSHSENLAKQQTLIMRSSGIYPINSDTKQNGFLDTLINKIFEKNGLILHASVFPSNRSLKYLNSGVIDGDMGRIGGLQNTYENIIQIPEKILEVEYSVFAKIKFDTSSGWDSIRGYKVGYLFGWEIIDENVPEDTKVIKTRSFEQLLHLLENDRIDLFIYNKVLGQYFLDKKQKNNIALSPPLAKQNMYIYLNKKYKNLVPEITQSLRELKSDGTYQNLYNEYLLILSHETNKD